MVTAVTSGKELIPNTKERRAFQLEMVREVAFPKTERAKV